MFIHSWHYLIHDLALSLTSSVCILLFRMYTHTHSLSLSSFFFAFDEPFALAMHLYVPNGDAFAKIISSLRNDKHTLFPCRGVCCRIEIPRFVSFFLTLSWPACSWRVQASASCIGLMWHGLYRRKESPTKRKQNGGSSDAEMCHGFNHGMMHWFILVRLRCMTNFLNLFPLDCWQSTLWWGKRTWAHAHLSGGWKSEGFSTRDKKKKAVWFPCSREHALGCK